MWRGSLLLCWVVAGLLGCGNPGTPAPGEVSHTSNGVTVELKQVVLSESLDQDIEEPVTLELYFLLRPEDVESVANLQPAGLKVYDPDGKVLQVRSSGQEIFDTEKQMLTQVPPAWDTQGWHLDWDEGERVLYEYVHCSRDCFQGLFSIDVELALAEAGNPAMRKEFLLRNVRLPGR